MLYFKCAVQTTELNDFSLMIIFDAEHVERLNLHRPYLITIKSQIYPPSHLLCLSPLLITLSKFNQAL